QVLTALAEQDLAFEVPVPVAPVDPQAPLGRCLLVTTRVLGQPLAALPDRQVEPAGRVLGRALASLAAATDALRPVVGPATDRWTPFADQVSEVLYPLMSGPGRRRAQRELDAVRALAAPADPVLVHRDFGGENLLWRSPAAVELSGVIDWDSLSLGDPAEDIASIAATYGWTLAGYTADHDAGTLARARTIRATFALQQALPAALSGDLPNLDDGLVGYR
ncbi:MAG TPA: aminoglycoside phosphotransferase family protein, partial [Micromonosporaceae bacterium]